MRLTLLIITNAVLAANNRGEGSGNLQVLQKIDTSDGCRTVVSAAAIKRAMRDNMIDNGAKMWRRNDDTNPVANPAGYIYGDNNSMTMDGTAAPTDEYDDAPFGFMVAPKGKSAQIVKRKGRIEVSNAVSTTPYNGGTLFRQGLKGGEPNLNPFNVEAHATRYSFTVTWELDRVPKSALLHTLNALRSLAAGGGHSSNANELTPAAIVMALHKGGGRSGLSCPLDLNIPTDVAEVDVSNIIARAQRIMGNTSEIRQVTSIDDVIQTVSNLSEVR